MDAFRELLIKWTEGAAETEHIAKSLVENEDRAHLASLLLDFLPELAVNLAKQLITCQPDLLPDLVPILLHCAAHADPALLPDLQASILQVLPFCSRSLEIPEICKRCTFEILESVGDPVSLPAELKPEGVVRARELISSNFSFNLQGICAICACILHYFPGNDVACLLSFIDRDEVMQALAGAPPAELAVEWEWEEDRQFPAHFEEVSSECFLPTLLQCDDPSVNRLVVPPTSNAKRFPFSEACFELNRHLMTCKSSEKHGNLTLQLSDALFAALTAKKNSGAIGDPALKRALLGLLEKLFGEGTGVRSSGGRLLVDLARFCRAAVDWVGLLLKMALDSADPAVPECVLSILLSKALQEGEQRLLLCKTVERWRLWRLACVFSAVTVSPSLLLASLNRVRKDTNTTVIADDGREQEVTLAPLELPQLQNTVKALLCSPFRSASSILQCCFESRDRCETLLAVVLLNPCVLPLMTGSVFNSAHATLIAAAATKLLSAEGFRLHDFKADATVTVLSERTLFFNPVLEVVLPCIQQGLEAGGEELLCFGLGLLSELWTTVDDEDTLASAVLTLAWCCGWRWTPGVDRRATGDCLSGIAKDLGCLPQLRGRPELAPFAAGTRPASLFLRSALHLPLPEVAMFSSDWWFVAVMNPSAALEAAVEGGRDCLDCLSSPSALEIYLRCSLSELAGLFSGFCLPWLGRKEGLQKWIAAQCGADLEDDAVERDCSALGLVLLLMAACSGSALSCGHVVLLSALGEVLLRQSRESNEWSRRICLLATKRAFALFLDGWKGSEASLAPESVLQNCFAFWETALVQLEHEK